MRALLLSLLLLLTATTAHAVPPTVTIEPIDSVVERGTTGTTQRFRIRRTGDTSEASTIRYGGAASGNNPANASDFFPTGLPQGSITFAGDPPNPTGQCAVSPPAAAAAEGLTVLAFCDDFSSDSVARGDTAAERELTAGKKWTTERAAGWGGTPDPASSFTFNADGTLTVQPIYGTYNWFMSSVVLRGGTLSGFWIAKKPKWYAEIRWKFQVGWSGSQQPAFWSMDACHTYGEPAPCPGGYYIEPDFWEYYFAAVAAHYYREGQTPDQSVSRCNDVIGSAAVAEDEWFTSAVMVTAQPAMKYYKNNNLIFTRTTTSPCSQANSSGMNTAIFINDLDQGDYPIFIGSKPGEIITIDYVRVWLAP